MTSGCKIKGDQFCAVTQTNRENQHKYLESCSMLRIISKADLTEQKCQSINNKSSMSQLLMTQ